MTQRISSIGEAEGRLVHRRHRRREPGHDEGGRLVERLRQVVDVAQAGDAGLGPATDAGEVGEAQRTALADRVAGQADALAVHDPAADLGHVGGGHVAGQDGVFGRLHFLLRHHLADIGVEARRREDEAADPDDVRDPHDVRLRPDVPLGLRRDRAEPGDGGLVRLEVGPVVQAGDPEDDADQEEEEEHRRRHDLRREAERRREGVGRAVADDAVDVPVLAEARSARNPSAP